MKSLEVGVFAESPREHVQTPEGTRADSGDSKT